MSGKMSSLPKILHETESPISGKIQVIQEGEERRLVVGGLSQSINTDAADVGERYWGALANTKGQKAKIKNTLILGLGGGTMAHLLTEKFGPIPIDAVELDPIVVEIGEKFFDLEKLSNLNIIVGDAVDFVNNQQLAINNRPYDLIIVDLYCGRQTPLETASEPFFAGLKKLATPKGSIVFNWISTKDDAKFEKKLGESFGKFEKKVVLSKFGGNNNIYTCQI